jgi:hypothetical protein
MISLNQMQNKTIRVAINGAGRIGRAFIRLMQSTPEIELVAINDLGDIENIAYLLKYDTAYGAAQFPVSVKEDPPSQSSGGASKKALVINGKEVKFLSEKEPQKLLWKDLNIDVVIESTGAFTTFEKAKAHVDAGAKRVIITAPAKGEPADETQTTVLMGINDEKLEKSIISSNALKKQCLIRCMVIQLASQLWTDRPKNPPDRMNPVIRAGIGKRAERRPKISCPLQPVPLSPLLKQYRSSKVSLTVWRCECLWFPVQLPTSLLLPKGEQVLKKLIKF